jgi:hypothetical protein
LPSLARKLPTRTLSRSVVRPLTASAMVKTGPDVDQEKTPGEGGFARSWQREAWDFYDMVGELHYAGAFVGACLSRIRLTIGVPDEEGVPGPAFDDEGNPMAPDAPEALDYLRQLRAQTGGQSALMRAFGINLFIAGEGYLVGTQDPTDQRSWEVLSVDELRPGAPKRVNGSARATYERRTEPNAPPEPLPAESYVVRVWRGHPRFAWLADAPTKAVREILEELVLLTREVRSQTLSRLASVGILIVPEEIDYPDDENASDESDLGDPFTRDLVKTISTAIADKASAAGQTPFVFRVPYDYADRVRHIMLERPRDEKSSEKRTEAVMRLARGLDLPVEIITGHAQTTFSNAWQIDESLFKSHIEPLVETVVDCLTIGYLRVSMPNTKLVISYDPSELVAHPDRSRDAKDGHDRFVISDSSYRRSIGFSDADAPDDEELERRMEIAERIKTPGTMLPGVAAPKAGAGEAPLSPVNVGPTTSGNASLDVAVEVSVLRALQKAGARIRSKANGNTSVREIIRGVPDDEVAATLGPALVTQVVGDEDLFRSEFLALRRIAARQVGAAAADDLARAAEAQARDRLWRVGV